MELTLNIWHCFFPQQKTKKEKIETFVISSSPISRSNVFDRMINKKWMKDKKENV
jgi:hypothetical protein